MARFPLVYVARHGETAWTITGQHTGLTDLPLTAQGESNARMLGNRLEGLEFASVLTSPLQRAKRTCELAGFGEVARDDPDLVEWNYGDFEGKTSAEIRALNPDWNIYRDGCPGGESTEEICLRAQRVVDRVRAVEGDVLLFSSSHFLRVLATRWLEIELTSGRCFFLGTAALSILGYEHELNDPVIRLWNEVPGTQDWV
jgi:broad specificity phosphatase PhoE